MGRPVKTSWLKFKTHVDARLPLLGVDRAAFERAFAAGYAGVLAREVLELPKYVTVTVYSGLGEVELDIPPRHLFDPDEAEFSLMVSADATAVTVR